MKINLDDDFHYFPPDFYKEHDRVYKEWQKHKDKCEAERKRRMDLEAKERMQLAKAAMSEIFKENEGTDAFSIKGKELVLVVPKDVKEIRAEGEALHHCVGSYVEDVAKGLTSIYFVRKASEPETPYYTMEFKNGRVWQCRGNRNCSMTTEVFAFTQVFAQKMNEYMKKQEAVKYAG